jgi:N-acetylglutamate synthase-like GNAT family acetyltransferase
MERCEQSLGIDISSFTDADQAGVLQVILPIQQQEFSIPVTAEDQPDLNAIPSFYQNGLGDFWVAKVNGCVVGTIALKDIGNRQVALRKMFVSAPYRGAHWGTAQRLLTTALTQAKERGVAQVFLGTTAVFHAAHRFYEKNGFTELSSAALPPSFPLMAVDSKFYTIDLDVQ